MLATVITVYLLWHNLVQVMSDLQNGIAKLLEGDAGSGIPYTPVICPSLEVPGVG